MTPAQADARLGLLVAYAFDMHAGAPLTLSPKPDPRLSPDWALRGYITAKNVLLHQFSWLEVDAPRSCYGFLVESAAEPGQFVAVVRGTADTLEWVIDAKFGQMPHPVGGHVEIGFYHVFATMQFLNLDGVEADVGIGISTAVDRGTLTVVGHSLGAALATFLTLEMAKEEWLGSRVRGRFFASPRPGDQAFADAFAAIVKDAVAYAFERDEVPEVPKGFGYLPLHCLQVITRETSQAVIADNLAASHHIYCYLAELDYALMNWQSVPAVDRDLTACILGPSSPAP